MLKELEHARLLLTQKNAENLQQPIGAIPVSTPNSNNNSVDVDQLICKDDESVNSDDFTLVTPKRIRKPPRRFSISAPKKKNGISKAKACKPSQVGEVDKGNLCLPKTFIKTKNIVIL